MDTRDWAIGFVGVGSMGGAMVEAILASGNPVTVYDIDAAASARVESLGAQRASDVGSLATEANLIFTSLPNPRAVRDTYLSEGGIVSKLRPGVVLVELSTIDPTTVEELERSVVERGAALLDVPVSGSPDEARQGELVLTAGGDRKTLDSVEHVLRCFGREIQYAGPVGAGKIVKIINNMMTMGNVLVAAEAFSVGIKAGIEPGLLFEILSHSGGRSHHFTKRFPNALVRNFEPGFSVALGEKDLALALDLAGSLGMPAPTAGLARQMYRIAMSEGLSSEDIVAVVKLFESWGDVYTGSSDYREQSDVNGRTETGGQGSD